MSDRLKRIYTKTGDKGETGLSGGVRVRKDCPQIQVIGDIDELNCVIGMVLANEVPENVRESLIKIQHQLFNLGAEINNAEYNFISADMVAEFEKQIDAFNVNLPPLKNFILPGGGSAAATCHLARAVCRRAERSVVALNDREKLHPNIQIYLNRLSDYLFVLSRVLSKFADQEETLWSTDY